MVKHGHLVEVAILAMGTVGKEVFGELEHVVGVATLGTVSHGDVVVGIAVLHEMLIHTVATQGHGAVLYHIGPEVFGRTPVIVNCQLCIVNCLSLLCQSDESDVLGYLRVGMLVAEEGGIDGLHIVHHCLVGVAVGCDEVFLFTGHLIGIGKHLVDAAMLGVEHILHLGIGEVADEVDAPVAHLEEALAPLLASGIEPSIAETSKHFMNDVERYVAAVLVELREVATVEACPHTVVGESANVAVESIGVVIEYGLALRHLLQGVVHALLQSGTHILILGGRIGQGECREVVTTHMSVEAEVARAPVGEVGVLFLPSLDTCLAEVGGEQAVYIVLQQQVVVEVEGRLEHAVGEGHLLKVEQVRVELALSNTCCRCGQSDTAG